MNYPNQIIKKGSKNSDAVKAIKCQLNLILQSTLDVNNGNFGASTESVVKQFQRSRSLLDDGEVGELTWLRLFGCSVAKPPLVVPSAVDLIVRVIQVAKSQLHVREKTGKNDGVDVEKYLKSVGLGKGYAYCAAFVYWCFMTASDALGVSNPVPKTAGVLDMFNKINTKNKHKIPKVGDVFVMDFGKGQGHMGIVTELRGSKVLTVEANTSADPTYKALDRDGNGNFERIRTISSINKGFLRFG